MFSAVDHTHMSRALKLARRGLFTTTPNPRVGCVIAHGDRVVGEGWHARAGAPHAEVHALREAGEAARGATAYITLEPCSHQGRTPPCAQALVAAGVARVVAAMQDPNPRVSGAGFSQLRAAGIAVDSGLLEDDAQALNVGFVARMRRGRPWLRVKSAASLDGRTALANGVSQWITGPAARRDGHRWRARSCAVLTGIGTLLQDNPRLTVRDVATTRQPLRIVVDRDLQLPPTARIFEDGPVLVFAAVDHPDKRVLIEARGGEVVLLPDARRKVDLAAMAQELARRELNEILVEAGNRLNGALLHAGVVDELVVYLAPQLLGDAARGMFDLGELTALEQRIALSTQDVRRFDGDLRLLMRVHGKETG